MKKIIFIWATIIITALIIVFIFINKATKDQTIISESQVEIFNFSESPMLKNLSSENLLEPVSERLPKVPLILIPLREIGEYGGAWKLQAKSKGDHNSFLRVMGYENLVRWNPSWTNISPNIAKNYEITNESKEFIFYLREGMRWSDGEPFTADDIIFWYENIFLNKDLSPDYISWLTSDSKPVIVEKINDYSIKFIFAEANSQFLQSLAHPRGAEITSYPKHYLSKFLPKYNPEINKLISAGGFNNYQELFIANFGIPGSPDEESRWQHPEVPTLNAWVFENKYGKNEIVKAKRNPYYWKIDIAGNQLPYIDFLNFTIVDDSNEIVDMAGSGEIDMQDRNIGNEIFAIISRKKLLEDKAEDGDYKLFKTIISSMNTVIVSFNLNHKDPILREIFQNKNFRIAVSHAINRQKIIDEVYSGFGEPYQAAPRPESPFYNEKMAKQYTEYSPEKANKYLDDIGLNAKDEQGFRLRPDGKPLTFTIDWGDPNVLVHIVNDLKEVGIKAVIGNTSNRSEFYSKKENNDHAVAIWKGDGGLEVIQEPRFYFPFSNESNYAIAWSYWFTAPNNILAEEPPAQVKEQMRLYKELMKASDQESQNEIMKQILNIATEEFYVIGISLPVDGFGIVKNNFKNVPETIFSSYVYPNPAPTNPAQYFISSK